MTEDQIDAIWDAAHVLVRAVNALTVLADGDEINSDEQKRKLREMKVAVKVYLAAWVDAGY